ncbi:MAG TPA: CoA-binding protein [bacterium]
MKEKIRYLFYPESIAVVGASTNPSKWGFVVLNNIVTSGYKGRIYAVNPGANAIGGIKCYKKINDLPEGAHLAVITLPREKVFDALKECIAKGVKSIMVITSGYSEAGKDHAELENKLVSLCRDAGIPMAGPNGQGIFNSFINLSATMAYYNIKPAKISFVSQSGNMGNTMIEWAKKYSMGFGKFISSGNEAMLKTEDYYDYFKDDPDTDVVISYIEGVDDGRRFFEKARELAKKKPLIILKSARTSQGKKSAESHTGAMAGSFDIFKAAVWQAGGILVQNAEEMGDAAFAFLHQPLPKGRKVGAVSEGGGWAVLVADALTEEGLELPAFPQELIAEFNKILPFYWSRNNPVDLVAERGEGIYEKVTELMASSKNVDIFMSLGVGYWYGAAFKIADSKLIEESMKGTLIDYIKANGIHQAKHLIELWKRLNKTVICASDIMLSDDFQKNEALKLLIDNGIFVYPTPDRAAKAVARLCWYAEYLRRREKQQLTDYSSSGA